MKEGREAVKPTGFQSTNGNKRGDIPKGNVLAIFICVPISALSVADSLRLIITASSAFGAVSA